MPTRLATPRWRRAGSRGPQEKGASPLHKMRQAARLVCQITQYAFHGRKSIRLSFSVFGAGTGIAVVLMEHAQSCVKEAQSYV